uniref:Photosystem II protein H n=2 Tax=Chromera velia TaxID=505693 RepID=D9IXG4_9ALVE|nr:photosystem II protein H [Chromera velia]ADJ66572.1 photosystem II protein H [Chromera velia]
MIKTFSDFFQGDPTPVTLKKTTRIGTFLKSLDLYSGLGSTNDAAPWGTSVLMVALISLLFLFLWTLLLICNQTVQVDFITVDWA